MAIQRRKGTIYLSTDETLRTFVLNKLAELFSVAVHDLLECLPWWHEISGPCSLPTGEYLFTQYLPSGTEYLVLLTRMSVDGRPRKLFVLVNKDLDVYTCSLVIDSTYFNDSLFYAVEVLEPEETLYFIDTWCHCGTQCAHETAPTRETYASIMSVALNLQNVFIKEDRSPFVFNCGKWVPFDGTLHGLTSLHSTLYATASHSFSSKYKLTLMK